MLIFSIFLLVFKNGYDINRFTINNNHLKHVIHKSIFYKLYIHEIDPIISLPFILSM